MATMQEFLDSQAAQAFDKTARMNWIQIKNSFKKLEREHQEIAIEGILRYLRACRLHGIKIDYLAAKEIVSDAKARGRVWLEQDYLTGAPPRP